MIIDGSTRAKAATMLRPPGTTRRGRPDLSGGRYRRRRGSSGGGGGARCPQAPDETQKQRQQRPAVVSPAPSPSWTVSAVSVAAGFLALAALSDWRSASSLSSLPDRVISSWGVGGVRDDGDDAAAAFHGNNNNNNIDRRRDLSAVVDEMFAVGGNDGNNIDDDITRNDICEDYLRNFLNGTTDSKDECAAMNKAWQLADCTDYKKRGDGDNGGGGDGLVPSWTPTRFLRRLVSVSISTYENFDDADNKANNATDDDVMIDDAFEKWECCSRIREAYNERCQEEGLDATKLLGIVLVMVVCGWMKSMLRVANIRFIPEAGACIIVGAIVGGILRLVQSDLVQDRLLAFDNDLFMQVMLPPIVFEAAITIDKRAFRRDLFPILTFAIIGTGFSAVAIAWVTYSLSNAGGRENGLPWLDSLLFGSLMSSIDPVATLSILSSVGVSQGDTLYTLVFGESLLNDGVSIVLFESLVRHMGDASVVDHATVSDTLAHFGIVTIGSLAVGVFCGALCTAYYWFLQGKQSAVSEVALFFAWALVPYYIADGLGLSGIISIMVMGFMLDYYVIGGHQSDEGEWMEYMQLRCPPGEATADHNHDSQQHSNPHHPVAPWFESIKEACCKAFSGRGLILSRSRHHVGFVAEVISNIMETAIFAYLGLFLFNDRVWDVILTISGLFACISSRAVMVILLSLLINACVWMDLEGMLSRLWRYCFQRDTIRDDDNDSMYSDTRQYLDMKTQVILFSAGVRGAVSYALVQNIPVYDAVTKHGSHFKGELRSMTSFTIVVILFALGALTYFTVQRNAPDEERVAGNLTHRLLSMSLASQEENNDDNDNLSDLNSSFEIEGHPPQHQFEGHRRGRRPRVEGSYASPLLLQEEPPPQQQQSAFISS